jgi:hypothetical protein
VPRSGSPELIEQEIWGYLLTRSALSALICAATRAGIDPDRVWFRRTVRIARRAAGPAVPAEHSQHLLPRSRLTSPAPGTRAVSRSTEPIGWAVQIELIRHGAPHSGCVRTRAQ